VCGLGENCVKRDAQHKGTVVWVERGLLSREEKHLVFFRMGGGSRELVRWRCQVSKNSEGEEHQGEESQYPTGRCKGRSSTSCWRGCQKGEKGSVRRKRWPSAWGGNLQGAVAKNDPKIGRPRQEKCCRLSGQIAENWDGGAARVP